MPKRASLQLSPTSVDELPILFGGIDLSSVNDLAALCSVGLQGDKWHTHCWFWLSSEGLSEKPRVDILRVELRLFPASSLRAGFAEPMISERFVAFPQTTKAMSPALSHLERLLLDRRVVHHNPCLTSCIVHTTIRMDPARNRAPDKKRATHRNDGTIGLLMALANGSSGAGSIDLH